MADIELEHPDTGERRRFRLPEGIDPSSLSRRQKESMWAIGAAEATRKRIFETVKAVGAAMDAAH